MDSFQIQAEGCKYVENHRIPGTNLVEFPKDTLININGIIMTLETLEDIKNWDKDIEDKHE